MNGDVVWLIIWLVVMIALSFRCGVMTQKLRNLRHTPPAGEDG